MMMRTTTTRVGGVWMGVAVMVGALALMSFSTTAQDLGTKGQGSPVANEHAQHGIFKNPTVPGLKGLFGKLRGKGGDSDKPEEPKTTDRTSTEDSELDMPVAAAAKEHHPDDESDVKPKARAKKGGHHPASGSNKPKSAAKKGGHHRDSPEEDDAKNDANGEREEGIADNASEAPRVSEDLDVTDAAKMNSIFPNRDQPTEP